MPCSGTAMVRYEPPGPHQRSLHNHGTAMQIAREEPIRPAIASRAPALRRATIRLLHSNALQPPTIAHLQRQPGAVPPTAGPVAQAEAVVQ